MTIKWPVLLVELLVVLVIAGAVYGYASGRFEHLFTPAPSTATVDNNTAAAGSALPPPPQIDTPSEDAPPATTVKPVKPRPVAPKVRRRVAHIKCSSIPAAASMASRETIISAMRDRGYSETQIRGVLRCLRK